MLTRRSVVQNLVHAGGFRQNSSFGPIGAALMVTATQLRLAELLRHNHVHRNLRSAVLVEHAIRRDEARLASNGALVAYTGRTGRSPKDKFTIKDRVTANQVHWGSVNQPFDADRFDALRSEEHTSELQSRFD